MVLTRHLIRAAFFGSLASGSNRVPDRLGCRRGRDRALVRLRSNGGQGPDG
jgi:hypothetical protein